jgi:hypothetical protein
LQPADGKDGAVDPQAVGRQIFATPMGVGIPYTKTTVVSLERSVVVSTRARAFG